MIKNVSLYKFTLITLEHKPINSLKENNFFFQYIKNNLNIKVKKEEEEEVTKKNMSERRWG